MASIKYDATGVTGSAGSASAGTDVTITAGAGNGSTNRGGNTNIKAGAAAGSLTIRNRLYAGAASKAVASASATIAAPILILPVGSVATTGYGLQPGLSIDLEGSLIIPQGYFVCTDTSIATTSSLIFAFSWMEISV